MKLPTDGQLIWHVADFQNAMQMLNALVMMGCVVRIARSQVVARKQCVFIKRGGIKPIGTNSHVRSLMKDYASHLLDDHAPPVGRVFMEFLKHLVSIQICSVLDIQTKLL